LIYYNIEERAIEIGKYLIDNEEMTVRSLSKIFNLSKTTIHNELTVRLPKANLEVANKVKEILDYHKEIKHIKGGEATKRKYI
jgi:putative DeoR family transcriptional regulator (stage III sporulation protein D)